MSASGFKGCEILSAAVLNFRSCILRFDLILAGIVMPCGGIRLLMGGIDCAVVEIVMHVRMRRMRFLNFILWFF